LAASSGFGSEIEGSGGGFSNEERERVERGKWGTLRGRYAEGLREKEGVRAVPRAAERFL
jgi:hypothetical protein